MSKEERNMAIVLIAIFIIYTFIIYSLGTKTTSVVCHSISRMYNQDVVSTCNCESYKTNDIIACEVKFK